MVRNIDTETFGTTQDFVRVRTLVADDAEELAPYLVAANSGAGVIFHVAEGTKPTLRKEFNVILEAQLVGPQLVAIHGTALDATDLGRLARAKATLVWSPFSNLWLYGQTADVASAVAKKVRICLGSDWAPSGTRNVLWELKVAHLWNEAQPRKVFTDEALVRLVTSNPARCYRGSGPTP